jgi:DNA-directed RNA polymerase specialized sigma24 family protein
MPDDESELIRRFKAGDAEAANALIGQYYDRVVKAAQKRLHGVRVRVTSEEDVAASVFESLWQRADEGRFSEEELASPDELWRLLSTMVRFKAHDHLRRESAKRRGGGSVRGESVFRRVVENGGGMLEVAANELSVSELVGFQEQHQILMQRLADEDLCEVATLRLEGFLVQEIADRCGKMRIASCTTLTDVAE